MLDMEFLFECSFCSLSSECSKLVRCWSHEEKLNIFKQPIVLFCPLNTFLFTYWWQRFWQYSEDFRTPLKITSHCWGPNYVVLINKFKYSLRNLFCNHSNHDFFTCKRYINMLFFYVWKYHVLVQNLTWYLIGVYYIYHCFSYPGENSAQHTFGCNFCVLPIQRWLMD